MVDLGLARGPGGERGVRGVGPMSTVPCQPGNTGFWCVTLGLNHNKQPMAFSW